MNFPLIAIGFVTSGIGYVYFMYGKRQTKLPMMVCGVVLMIYPYFIENWMLSLGVGAVLSAIPFVLKWW